MKSKLLLKQLLAITLSFCSIIPAIAQFGPLISNTVTIPGTTSPGHLLYRPSDYATTATRYPLIIYFMGIGAAGDGSAMTPPTNPPTPVPQNTTGLDRLFTGSGAPHEQMRNNSWVEQYTDPVTGQPFKFLYMVPQFTGNGHIASADEINRIIDYAISSNPNRVDTTRIYLMGHSQGGGSVLTYPGAASGYANRIAAAVAFGSVHLPKRNEALRLKYAPTALWLHHAQQDPSVPYEFSQQYVQFYNSPNPAPTIPAKLTNPNVVAHDVWTGPLNRQPITGEPQGSPNVYEWLLQYRRVPTRVFAGEDQFIEITPGNMSAYVQLAGTGTGPNNTVNTVSWLQLSGPTTAQFSSTTSLTPTVSNLQRGTYLFQLTITDNASATNSDVVAVVVDPAPLVRQQAEVHGNSSPVGVNPDNGLGIVYNPTVDGTGANGIRVDGIGRSNTAPFQNDFMEYNITVPTAGVYTFKLRAGARTGGTSIRIEDVSTGNLLDSIRFYLNTGEDVHEDYYAYSVELNQGTNLIRIRNGDMAYGPNEFRAWYINWFEVFAGDLSGFGTLPVRFGQVNVRCNNGSTELSWRTSQEQNTKEFLVQRSSNGIEWSSIGTVSAVGQSNTERSYTFRDAVAINNGQYRVVAVDFDGRQTISTVLRNTCGRARKVFEIFPNPIQSDAIVKIGLERETTVRLTLFNQAGALVRDLSLVLPAGTTQLPFNVEGLPSGSYTLRAAWSNEVQTIKIIKGK